MIGVILAGGASSRFDGKPKGLALLGDKPLALHIAETLQAVCSNIVIEASPGVGYEKLSIPLCTSDGAHAGKGPIAGMIAGLKFAQSQDAEIVAFAPCDMPFLTPEHYRKLEAGLDDADAAYAVSPNGADPLVAIVRISAMSDLEEALKSEIVARAHVILDRAGAIGVRFSDPAAFRNINTPTDLAKACLDR